MRPVSIESTLLLFLLYRTSLMELEILIKIKLLMDSINFLLKLGLSSQRFSKDFNHLMKVSGTLLQEYTLQKLELEEAFNSLKSNKSSGFDNISSCVINFCISGIFHSLKHIFNLSLHKEFLFTNYRPISVLPCFSKLLERLMYNWLYKYLYNIITSMRNNLGSRLQIQRNMRLYS